MFKNGVALKKYMMEDLKKHVQRQKDKVINSIKQDGVERLSYMLYKRLMFKLAGHKGTYYRMIGMTQQSAEDMTVEITDKEGIKPPQEVPFIAHFLSTHQLAIHHPYWPCLRLEGEDGEAFNLPIEYLKIYEDPLEGGDEGESSTGFRNDRSSSFVPSLVNHKNESKTKMVNDMSFDEHDQVMFIGGYVNHLADRSIAAVVGTVDWPKTKPFAAMVRAQTQGEEKILHFGEACSKLVEAHMKESGGRPNKLVIFRYEVSQEILREELQDLKNNLGGYTPNIAVIMATKHASDPALKDKLDDNIDFYIYRLGVRYDYEFFYNSGNFSMSSLLLYLCYNESTMKMATPVTYTFQMVPPIIYAHLAADKVHEGGPINEESWIRHDVK